MISVETKKEGDPARTIAVLGCQQLEFTIPEGGRLELAPGEGGRSMVYTVDATGKPVGEANMASDTDARPASSAKADHPGNLPS